MISHYIRRVYLINQMLNKMMDQIFKNNNYQNIRTKKKKLYKISLFNKHRSKNSKLPISYRLLIKIWYYKTIYNIKMKSQYNR